jgi:transcriptional regulator with XRE-family HTH domain
MNTINHRLKELRKELNMTQESFGSRISLVSSGISNMEKGVRDISDRTIKIICKEFNVSEEWLRNGEGSMFVEAKYDLAEFIGERIHSLNDFQINAIKEFIKLPPEHTNIIMNFIRKIAK